MSVEVFQLVKTFGQTQAVRNISFSIEPGKITGFVGPNGAGKTTTMRMISTLEDPTSGRILVNGVSAVHEPDKVRRMVGFVPDLLPTHSDINVVEYLDFFARAYGLRGKEREQAVASIVSFTHLTDLQDKLLKALSKGMKQRVNLGRALIHNPDVLILDEPAAGLDPRARVELRELLNALRDQGKAIFISSHILTELTEICDSVVIIEQGSILETGSIRDITERSTPRRVVLIRSLDDVDQLHRKLLESPHVEEVRHAGHEVAVEFEGSEEACHHLLQDLMQQGFRIVEFRQQQADLEDIFMRITQGKVQ